MIVTLMRKPLTGSLTATIIVGGGCGLHVDACRIATTDDFSKMKGFQSMKLNKRRVGESLEEYMFRVREGPEQQEAIAKLRTLGRFPPNIMLKGIDMDGAKFFRMLQ